MPDRYLVLGNPIAQSLSPQIHAMFAAQTSQDIQYASQLVALDDFATTITRFVAEGGRGANITAPFKEEAFCLATRRSAHASAAGAVNTLSFHGSEIVGDNTDGIGLIRDLTQNLATSITGRRVLLLGAGGAARGVLLPLLAKHPEVLVISNRTTDKAKVLAASVAQAGAVEAISLDALIGREFDLIVNATSAALNNGVSPAPTGVFAAGALAYDMTYGRETAFMTQARECDARASDGLGMLVEQAAESFYIWRGVRPDTAPVLLAMREMVRKQMAVSR